MTPTERVRAHLTPHTIDPDVDGVCPDGHLVRGGDHAKPVRLPDGSVIWVCVFCWQALDLARARAEFPDTEAGRRSIADRQALHEQTRSALLVDDVAVERVLNSASWATGHTAHTLTVRERWVMVQRGIARGMTRAVIADLAGMPQRSIERYAGGQGAVTMDRWERSLVNYLARTEPARREQQAAA